MNRFEDAYKKIWFRLQKESWLKNPGRCKHEWFNLTSSTSLILEMNSMVFPIPKDLLSALVKDCYESNWELAREYAFPRLMKLMKSSENISRCNIDWDKMNEQLGCYLALICLPYDIESWKKNLSNMFNDDDIERLFYEFDGQKGVYGTYSNGHVIVLNSDYIDSLKSCEEAVEHELVHMIESINGDDESCSPMMLHILGNTNETKTWTISLINALLGLYDHMQAMSTSEDDTFSIRKKFLDKIFSDAAIANDSDELWKKYESFSTSRLLKDNLTFLWRLLRWEPEELPKIKQDIYDEFLEE